jgi:hypothetical protein
LYTAKNAHAAILMRRAPSAESSASVDPDNEGGMEGRHQLSICSTESSVLAGVAIDSSTSSDATNANTDAPHHGVRPDKPRLHLHRGAGGVVSPGGCALAAATSPTAATAPAFVFAAETVSPPGASVVTTAESCTSGDLSATTEVPVSPVSPGADGKPKSRQLSLTQFFKPRVPKPAVATVTD